jgi:hypothetical protein
MNAFADLPEFEGMVSVAIDKDDFCRKLVDETENDSAEKIQKRIAFASANSWDARTQQFAEIIEQFIEH